MICEIDEFNQPTNCIKTNFNAQQVCSISVKLPKGRYAFIGQIYPFRVNKDQFPEEKVTLSINSNK
jgi:hypothetical protein